MIFNIKTAYPGKTACGAVFLSFEVAATLVS